MRLPIQIVDTRLATEWPLPRHACEGDAGIDLRACTEGVVFIYPDERMKVRLGIKVEVPVGHVLLLMPRSGLGARGLVLANVIGVIDASFRGEIVAVLFNTSDAPIKIEPGDRVCQALLMPVCSIELDQVEQISESERGEAGLGHTGMR